MKKAVEWFKGLKLWAKILIVVLAVGAIGAIFDDGKSPTASTASNSKPASEQSKPEPTPTPIKYMVVTASQVLKDYKDNKIAADEKYKDKHVQVTGYVDSIGSGTFGGLYITIGSGAQFEMTKVQCSFDDSYKAKLAKLKPGQKVTIKGMIDGYNMNIGVRDASI